MNNTTTTPTLTPEQKENLLNLVAMRHVARKLVQTKAILTEAISIFETARLQAIQIGDARGEALVKIDLDETNEAQLELKFQIIELGRAFIVASSHYDQLPREVWLRALCVNEAEWDSPDMLKYGDTIRNVVAVMSLENSATKDDAVVHKPLNWCCTMGMLHTSRTNTALGKVMHDDANEILGGVLGEYQEPTMLERMGVR